MRVALAFVAALVVASLVAVGVARAQPSPPPSPSIDPFADGPTAPKPPAPASVAPSAPILTTLEELLARGAITRADYERRLADMRLSVGESAAASPTLGVRWSANLYGFVSLAAIWDSTEGQNDVPGNKAIARPDLYEGQNGRMTFSVRFTRLGLQLRTPEVQRMRASALIEIDALGTETPGASESVIFTSPGIRLFNAALRLETPWVDLLIGQWWDLFGWQPYLAPSFGQFSGLPGEVSGRVAQIRLSHRFTSRNASVEIAAAMVRPPSRDSGVPEGEAGVALMFERWVGFHTLQAVASIATPATIGVSGTVRHYAELSKDRMADVATTGWGVSVDALVPIIPGTAAHHGNALTLTGSYVYSVGGADKYVGLITGQTLPDTNLPHVGNPGLVAFDTTGGLDAIKWQSFMVGAQYYLPPSGRLWVSANYTDLSSKNVGQYGVAFLVWNHARSADANLFVDVIPSLRLGLEYVWMDQIYVDGVEAKNHRAQLSAYYLF